METLFILYFLPLLFDVVHGIKDLNCTVDGAYSQERDFCYFTEDLKKLAIDICAKTCGFCCLAKEVQEVKPANRTRTGCRRGGIGFGGGGGGGGGFGFGHGFGKGFTWSGSSSGKATSDVCEMLKKRLGLQGRTSRQSSIGITPTVQN